MTVRIIEPATVLRLLELAEGPYRPPQIRDLEERIQGETRALELRATVTNSVNEDEVLKIVKMRLELDQLYAAWAAGEIS